MSSKHTKAGRRARFRRHHTRIAEEAMGAWHGRGLAAWLKAEGQRLETKGSA